MNTPQEWPFKLEDAVQIGEGFTLSQLKDFTNNFRCEVRVDTSKENDSLASKFVIDGVQRKGEFFGIEKINKLITAAKRKGRGVAGVRVYYGLAYEHIDNETGRSTISTKPIKEAVLRPRLFIVPVDNQGKDIEINIDTLKDSPDGSGLGDGAPQPPFPPM